MADTIQIKRGLAATWTSVNPTLLAGQQGYETDTGRLKIGNGTVAWNSLPYHNLLWEEIGSDIVPATSGNNISLGTGGLKDVDVTVPVRLGSPIDSDLDTVKQSLIGAINEVHAEITALDSVTSGTNTGDETASRIAAINHAAPSKPVLVDADEFVGQNSASSFSLIRFTLGNIKSVLATYFSSLYEPIFSKNTGFNRNFSISLADIKSNGVQSLGVLDSINRADHVHPSDASKINHSLATAANDFLVASGSGVFAKRTQAEVMSILSVSGTNTGDETTSTLSSKLNSVLSKVTPVNADVLYVADSADSNLLKKLSFSNLVTYLNTLYNMYVHPTTPGNRHVPNNLAGVDDGKVLTAGTVTGDVAWLELETLTFSDGVTRDVDNITNDLITGKSGGQTIVGDELVNGVLSIRGTALDTSTGSIHFVDEKEATSVSVAAAVFSGGIGVAKRSFFGGLARFNSAVSIGASSSTSVLLGLHSTSQAFLLPRATTTQIEDILPVQAGMVMYDTTINRVVVYDGSSWRQLNWT